MIFVGSCGTFGDFQAVKLVTARSVHWLPACERAGIAYQVQGTAPSFSGLSTGPFGHGLPAVDVICAPCISLTSEGLPAEFTPTATVENLELYAVTPAILEAAASFSILLGVTNSIGPSAHQEWKAHWQSAATQTAQHVRNLLSAGS